VPGTFLGIEGGLLINDKYRMEYVYIKRYYEGKEMDKYREVKREFSEILWRHRNIRN
jgi:hypothetical protein